MKYNNDVIFILSALFASVLISFPALSGFVSIPAHIKSTYAASNNNDASGTEDSGTKGEDTGTTRQSPDVNEPCPVSEQIRNRDTGLCESVQVEGQGSITSHSPL